MNPKKPVKSIAKPNAPTSLLLLSLLAFLTHAAPARAQWYAPATNYHDPVQRVFPVELARVLAWRENAAATNATTTNNIAPNNAANHARIAEIRYTVTNTDDNGGAHWEILWLDANGKTLSGVKINYAPKALLAGPKFYREITAKMLAAHSWAPPKGTSPADLDNAFWSGLGDMKPSRMTALQFILKDNSEHLVNLPDKLRDSNAAARLSGQLLSATVPGALAGLLTIDSTLAARGAAWLALSELGLPARDPAASDARWAIVLWLARREFQAQKLWGASQAPDAAPLWSAVAEGATAPADTAFERDKNPGGDKKNTIPKSGVAGRSAPSAIALQNSAAIPATRAATNTTRAREWWSFMLTRHTARDAYLRAVRYDDPAWGLPLLARGARLEGNSSVRFAQCARAIYPDLFTQAHDYAPWIGGPAGSVDCTQYAMLLAPPARNDWFAAINMLSDDEIKSVDGLDDALSTMHKLQARPVPAPFPTGANATPSAADIPATKLTGILYKSGAAPLAPVSTVTISDMTNFGWELHGTQAQTLFFGLAKWLGLMQPAKQLAAMLAKNSPELVPFINASAPASAPPSSPVDYNRFLRMENKPALPPQPPAAPATTTTPKNSKKPKTGAPATTRNSTTTTTATNPALADQTRAWLMLLGNSSFTINAPILERLATEGGPMLSRKILTMLIQLDAISTKFSLATLPFATRQSNPANNLDDYTKHKDEFAAPLLPDAYLDFELHRAEIDRLPGLERAQAYERAFWSDPHDDLVPKIFDLYMEAQALPAATRFYDHAVPVMTNPLVLSNNIAPARMTIAILDGDFDTAEKILKQSNTNSYQDYINHIALAAARNDTALLEKLIKSCMTRYAPPSQNQTTNPQSPNVQLRKLLDFLPLWPAITTPGHPDREKALDYFSDYDEWPTVQWILIKQTHMSAPDAIRFLGGDKAQKERRILVDYLRGDKASFKKHYNTAFGLARMAKVVIYSLRAELLNIPSPADAPDLSPPEPQNIVMAVTTARAAYLKPNIDERLATLTTQETLWNHIDALNKTTYSETQDARSRLLEAEAAYKLYQQRYPQGKHIWETRLWLLANEQGKKIRAATTVPVTATPPPPPADFDPKILEIVNAPAAPMRTRLGATLLAFQAYMTGRPKLTPDERTLVLTQFDQWRQTLADSDDVATLDLLEATLWGAENPTAVRSALARAATSKNPQIATQAAEKLRLMDFWDAPLAMTFTAIDGRKVDSATLRGKVVLLYFWATWVPASVAEIPKIRELYNKYNNAGLQVVGVTLDVDKSTLQKFTAANLIPWPNYFYENKSEKPLFAEWGAMTIPMKCLIDKAGRKHPLSPGADVEAEIKKLLGL